MRLARPVWLCCLTLCMSSLAAEPLPREDAERDCWLSNTRERTRVRLNDPSSVDFSNLRDGFTVRSPFRVDFSVRGMGVVPAGKAHPKAGHHHILIDQPLPQRVGDQIPFNDKHRHFGKGQTSTQLSLPPGEHTLRLLFADHEHRPYFVFSPEIRVKVLGPREKSEPPRIDPANVATSCALWYQEEMSRPRPAGARVLVGNLRDGEPVGSPVNLRFMVEGFGVAARGHGGEGLGHFQLELASEDGQRPSVPDLSGGATQANLFLPVGRYRLRLQFLDDQRKPLLPPFEMVMPVVSTEKL